MSAPPRFEIDLFGGEVVLSLLRHELIDELVDGLNVQEIGLRTFLRSGVHGDQVPIIRHGAPFLHDRFFGGITRIAGSFHYLDERGFIHDDPGALVGIDGGNVVLYFDE